MKNGVIRRSGGDKPRRYTFGDLMRIIARWVSSGMPAQKSLSWRTCAFAGMTGWWISVGLFQHWKPGPLGQNSLLDKIS